MPTVISDMGTILFFQAARNPIVDTLYKVRDLIIGSIPTIILLLLLWFLYTVLVYRPLGRVLEERYRRTEGAFGQARADIQAAELRTAEYERQLREARAAVFAAQEERQSRAAQARATAVQEARRVAEQRIKEARQ